MSKKKTFNKTMDGTQYLQAVRKILHEKYFNAFLSMYAFEGDGIDYRKNRYILKKLYYDGEIAAFKGNKVDTLEFADFAPQDWDIYDMPVHARLINKRGSILIPNKVLEIDKDIVVCYLLHSHDTIYSQIDWYVDKLALIEGVMRTNLYTNNMPFLIALSPEDKEKLNVLMNKILSLDPAVAVDFTNIENLKLLNLQPAYIIDKLYKYKKDLENDLLTYLGINNTGLEKQERLLVDEVNANNEEIQTNGDKFLTTMGEFCERIKNVLGFNVSVKRTYIDPLGMEENNHDELHEEDNDLQ